MLARALRGRKMRPAAAAPRSAPIASATRSAGSASRFGTRDWCHSSLAPYADARTAARTTARQGHRRVRASEAATRPPSTAYAPAWSSLSNEKRPAGRNGNGFEREEIQ